MENSPKPSVVLGYNHNIKHKGNIFHVQTEDSGTLNPHIITHLFVGGNVIATKKTSYADIVHAENLEEIVRELMQEQHKAILRSLLKGEYDAVFAQRLGRSEPTKSASAKPAPISARKPAQSQAKSNDRSYMTAKPAPGKFPLAQQASKQAVGSGKRPEITQPGVKFAPVTQGAPKSAKDPKTAKQLVNQAQDSNQPSSKDETKEATGATIFGEDMITEKSLDEVILGYLSGDADEKS